MPPLPASAPSQGWQGSPGGASAALCPQGPVWFRSPCPAQPQEARSRREGCALEKVLAETAEAAPQGLSLRGGGSAEWSTETDPLLWKGGPAALLGGQTALRTRPPPHPLLSRPPFLRTPLPRLSLEAQGEAPLVARATAPLFPSGCLAARPPQSLNPLSPPF